MCIREDLSIVVLFGSSPIIAYKFCSIIGNFCLFCGFSSQVFIFLLFWYLGMV